jgi:phosphoglycolate phosphatase-like HAD superfamily hydrolase
MKQKLGRSWDAFDAYLFDIDGTLIHCTDATHYFAFSHALKMLSGRELTIDGVTAHGNTDIGIVRDAFALAGIPENEWRPHVSAIRQQMGDFVEARKADLCTITLPSVREVLEHLRAKGAKLAVATGNLERIGKLKLERAGLFDYFQFGGWSDAHEYRSDVFRAAIAQARELWGEAAALCIVGDTPADIRAAHDHHVPVIAVATGIYTFEQLMQEQPEMCLHSFEELWPQSKPHS